MSKPTGYILYEDDVRVCIATMSSSNRKTGPMVQTWILYRKDSPLAALKSGKDKAVCGSCRHRPTRGKRSCYVNVGHAPQGIWKAYQRGIYPRIFISDYRSIFGGKSIRFGAYGDPAAVPTEIWKGLTTVTFNHTAYTHNWKRGNSLRELAMASVDSVEEQREAVSAGWRTFRVAGDTAVLSDEIRCPASEEAGHKTQCIKCHLCDGKRASDRRKNIVIMAHGVGSSHFIRSSEILAAPRIP